MLPNYVIFYFLSIGVAAINLNPSPSWSPVLLTLLSTVEISVLSIFMTTKTLF